MPVIVRNRPHAGGRLIALPFSHMERAWMVRKDGKFMILFVLCFALIKWFFG